MTESKRSARRLDDLLLKQAIEGLDAAEQTALRALLAEHTEVDEHRYERAAAAVLLASLPEITPMPAGVQRRLAGRWRGRTR
jgi:hypothetical protein